MDNKILIEPIINEKTHGFAIQGKVFDFNLKVTNLSEKPSVEFNISLINLKSAQGQDLADDFGKKSFFVKKLNPNEYEIIKIGKNGQFMYGLVSIDVNILPVAQQDIIVLHQVNSFTKEVTEIGKNKWVDFFYIKSLNEYEQERANSLMVILTTVILLLTIVIAIPAIKELIKFFIL